jgi:hypothetical protein
VLPAAPGRRALTTGLVPVTHTADTAAGDLPSSAQPRAPPAVV